MNGTERNAETFAPLREFANRIETQREIMSLFKPLASLPHQLESLIEARLRPRPLKEPSLLIPMVHSDFIEVL